MFYRTHVLDPRANIYFLPRYIKENYASIWRTERELKYIDVVDTMLLVSTSLFNVDFP